MAELINKVKLVEAMVLSHTAHANNSREASLLNRDVRIVMEQPTVTESKIRAKAISDFIKALEEHTQKNWIDYHDYGITFADLELVAEQLKESE